MWFLKDFFFSILWTLECYWSIYKLWLHTIWNWKTKCQIFILGNKYFMHKIFPCRGYFGRVFGETSKGDVCLQGGPSLLLCDRQDSPLTLSPGCLWVWPFITLSFSSSSLTFITHASSSYPLFFSSLHSISISCLAHVTDDFAISLLIPINPLKPALCINFHHIPLSVSPYTSLSSSPTGCSWFNLRLDVTSGPHAVSSPFSTL